MRLTEAQVARVRSLEDAAGRLTADLVVEDAKNRTSPLHPLFTWDRSKAAAAYWLAEAREVIASVRLVVTNETTTLRVPVYVRATDMVGQGYRSVRALRADPAQARESLIYTLEVAAGHLRRAMDLAGPLGLSADIDRLIEEVVGVQRALEKAA